MSLSSTHKQLSLAVCCAIATFAVGCGSGAQQQVTTEAVTTATTAPSGAAAKPATEPQANPAPTREANLVPVDVDLKNGSFAKGTPPKVHVPSDFLVLITARADEQGPYKLSVLSPSTAQTFKIPSGETQRITQDGLASGQEIKLILGKQTLRIVADAEPGP